MPDANTVLLRALAARSLAIIRAAQAPSGAYVASPSFPVYGYSWFRDGAFIADAMSRAGEIESAEAFFDWCAGVLDARIDRVEGLIDRATRGESVAATDHLHTRYTLGGQESDAEWWNFQLDGYGAWLWALEAHVRRHGRPIERFLGGAVLSARYIEAFWREPSYDWWEEHPEHRHVSTLGAVAAGLRAASRLPGVDSDLAARFGTRADAIVETLHEETARLGYLPKWLGGDAVDASLLALGGTFELFAPDDPTMIATVARIEAELVHAAGVHRYLDDTYYGGGEWLPLAGFLGLHHVASGRPDAARDELAWMARQATPDDLLPEQVSAHLLAPDRYTEWVERWGPIATPLLWSHAMYVSLAVGLGVMAPLVASER
ncbi:MAG: glycoside hydrolase family 15 protein [Chloroflexota bacterium]